MISPISSIVANLFMEEFGSKAISTTCNPPRFWLRYVDGAFVIQQPEHSQQLFQNINNIGPHIQFIIEVPSSDGSIPFLDTLVSPGHNNTLVTIVCRKPTHTDEYLHWDSHHILSAKDSVFNTQTHRAGLYVLSHICFTERRKTSGRLYTEGSTPL